MSKFGKNVRDIRAYLRLTQSELAKKIGTHQSVISQIETGIADPTADLVAKTAHLFDLSIAAINGEEPINWSNVY